MDMPLLGSKIFDMRICCAELEKKYMVFKCCLRLIQEPHLGNIMIFFK